MQRIDSGEVMQWPSPGPEPAAVYASSNGGTNGHVKSPSKRLTGSKQGTASAIQPPPSQPSLLSLIVCVSGIYVSFLTWGLLQERITTTPYPVLQNSRDSSDEYFRYPIFVNTIQALFAFLSGSLYLLLTTGTWSALPSRAALPPLLLVSITTTLASPFGYASLAHVDYLTFVLAKSCKLLPVMALHITLFRRRYPLSKYLIVLAVTAGVAIFTLYHPPKPGKSKSKNAATSSYYGLALLGINLLFDGLTNVVQDHIFQSPHRYGRIKGPQMMVSNNLIGFVLQASYLLSTPLVPSTLLSSILPSSASSSTTHEFTNALAFLHRHPSLLNDILGFCAAGAVGQLFIFATLERFSSLVLVTVTVTRKMLTMLLSVAWYGKSITGMQWAGVAMVFSGVAGEAWLSQREKARKHKDKREKSR